MKCWRKLSALVALLCLFFAFGLFGTNNAYAATTTNINPIFAGRRAYSSPGSPVYYDGWSSYQNLPLTIIGLYDRSVWGVSMEGNFPGATGSERYKTVTVAITLRQKNSVNNNTAFDLNMPVATSFYTSAGNVSDGINKTVTQGAGTITITLQRTFDDNRSITGFISTLGKISDVNMNTDRPIVNVCVTAAAPECMAAPQIQSVVVTVDAYQDPNTVILNQQLEIQQQQQAQDQQDRNDIENTSEQAEQDGENAGAAASATGQTLMQAFSSLITALTSIHQTDCNLPNFSIYGLTFNNMNMCMFDVPSGLMGLASIGMVFIIVPLGINLVKRMIALYNEIVGGGK